MLLLCTMWGLCPVCWGIVLYASLGALSAIFVCLHPNSFFPPRTLRTASGPLAAAVALEARTAPPTRPLCGQT